jgi:hypothetical protein
MVAASVLVGNFMSISLSGFVVLEICWRCSSAGAEGGGGSAWRLLRRARGPCGVCGGGAAPGGAWELVEGYWASAGSAQRALGAVASAVALCAERGGCAVRAARWHGSLGYCPITGPWVRGMYMWEVFNIGNRPNPGIPSGATGRGIAFCTSRRNSGVFLPARTAAGAVRAAAHGP